MNYYSIERSTDHLAHYGVKGMKWGVRKALASGNEKALDKHYRKAAKKLAKLQDIGLNSPKYAAKAAAYGAAAAGTGTVARLFPKLTQKFVPEVKSKPTMERHGLGWWPNKTERIPEHFENTTIGNVGKYVSLGVHAGLLGAAGLNAYRAASGRKYREKAVNWKNAMDDAFKRTKYSKQYDVPEKKKRKIKHSGGDYMGEYYAVIRNSEELHHYGVKGMRWGVRKAIDKGNQKSLDRQYKKAAKKLEKLSKRADIETQNKNAEDYRKASRASTKAGLAALGAGTGIKFGADINYLLGRHYANKAAETGKKYADSISNFQAGNYSDDWFKLKQNYKNASNEAYTRANKFYDHDSLASGLIGAGLGGLGYGGYAKVKSEIAKNRTTKEGHAKAVAKRDAWKKEMQSAFKGTKYSNIPKIQKKRRK